MHIYQKLCGNLPDIFHTFATLDLAVNNDFALLFGGQL